MQERTRDDTRERGSPDVRERERRRDKGRRNKKGKCERNENRGLKQDMIREQKDIPLLVYSSSFFLLLFWLLLLISYFWLLLFYSFHLCLFLCFFSCSAFICIRENEAHFADKKSRSSLRRSINYTEEIIWSRFCHSSRRRWPSSDRDANFAKKIRRKNIISLLSLYSHNSVFAMLRIRTVNYVWNFGFSNLPTSKVSMHFISVYKISDNRGLFFYLSYLISQDARGKTAYLFNNT